MSATMFRMSVLLVALMFSYSTLAAQTDCPTIVRDALEIAGTACSATGRNQACYGNVTLNAVPQPGASSFTFNQTGDMVNVADVQSLTLSSLDAAAKQWGIALLKIQANLPDTLPGQNVTMLLFGDVHIQNANESTSAVTPPTSATAAVPPAAVQVTSDQSVDVRSIPDRSAKVIAKMSAGETLRVDGMDASAAFLHVTLADGSVGWVQASKVTIDGDAGSLPVLDADNPAPTAKPVVDSQPTAETTATPQSPSFGPMQAFYFKSGLRDRPCSQAPDSGILIQSPKGTAGIDLTVNAVHVTLGSTAYFQAQPGGDMIISVVEGHGTASAFNKTVTIPAGSRVRIPIDTNLQASGPPADPEPYVSGDIAALPLQNMPDVITSASPLTTEEILALKTPKAGSWILTYDQAYIDVGCAADAYNGGFATDLSYDSNGVMSWYSNTLFPSGYGVYKSVPNPGATSPHLYTMVVTSPTHIEGQNVWIVPGCATITNNFHLELQKATN